MAFFTPDSGNSLFFGVHSLFCRGPMRLWKFLIWRFFLKYLFFSCFYFHIFDLLVLWLLLSVFHVLFWCFVFVFLLNYIFATESFLAHFSIFLLRIRPWECHIRILRKKLYRVHKLSSKLAPWELVLGAFIFFQCGPSRLWTFLNKNKEFS